MGALFDDTQLFNSGGLLIKDFDIPDAALRLYEHYFHREESDPFYKILLAETPWKQEPVTHFEKLVATPRVWQTPGRYACYAINGHLNWNKATGDSIQKKAGKYVQSTGLYGSSSLQKTSGSM